MCRYGNKPEPYLRIFHYLYRKTATTSLIPIQILFKILFRVFANLRGLEITANQQIRGGAIFRTCI